MTHLTLLPGGLDDTWRDRAACHGTDIFFPHNDRERQRALRLCTTCPVRQPCLEYALDRHIKFGIWGGMTERGRQRETKRRKNGGAA